MEDQVHVREIDPRDETDLRGWWSTGHAATADRPVEAWPAWPVAQAIMGSERSDVERLLLAAEIGGEVVGGASAFFFLLENTHLAELMVFVDPAHRRRGVGTALLVVLEERARRSGRRTAAGTVHAPVDTEGAGLAFASAAGYVVANAEETKLVDLTSAPALWPALDAEVAAHLGGCTVDVFVDVIPEEYVEGACRVLSAFTAEAPHGDLELESSIWTPERLQETQDRVRATGRRWVVALASDPDGQACGFSEVALTSPTAVHAQVGGTLVLPGHRGRRLGLALKLATHRRLMEIAPDCRTAATSNAGVNAPMNAVNERLGYRVVERALDVQKSL